MQSTKEITLEKDVRPTSTCKFICGAIEKTYADTKLKELDLECHNWIQQEGIDQGYGKDGFLWRAIIKGGGGTTHYMWYWDSHDNHEIVKTSHGTYIFYLSNMNRIYS